MTRGVAGCPARELLVYQMGFLEDQAEERWGV
jgi:hypothetical protein